MAPSRVAGGLSQNSASSDILFQGDAQSQNVMNSHLSSLLGNSASSISGTGRSNLGPVSGDIANHSILNSVANSGPSVDASSLVTDANSSFSGGPQFQRSASTNTDSYLGLPASPLSFTSNNNNISTSNSSVIDGSPQQAIQTQLQFQQGVSSVNSLPSPHTGGQLPLAMGPRIANCFVQDPANLSQLQKKQRLDKQEDILKQQVMQQVLQRQDGMQFQGNNPQFQGHNPQLQAIIHQQRLMQQQQMLHSMPQMQRLHLQQQQHQARQHLQQQQQMAVMKNPYETGGVCARRLMQYLYHQRQRPPVTENSIAYWRKFVAEYYAPRAKKRWCLSQYDNVGHNAPVVFPQPSMAVWSCEICGSKSGKGFEATYEVLPRLNEIMFGSGVIDELLFVDLPREHRFANGIMILEYGKAVQESVYEQLRVVREGKLKIIFTQELKILAWDFCAWRHEELLPKSVVAPQVNQLLQVAQICQSSHADSGSDGLSSQDLQTNSNMVVTASRQLAKSMELQSLNGLGFSKRFARSLQTAEVVNSMKDLMDFCRDNRAGPIEGLKNYPRHAASTSKHQNQRTQEMDNQLGIQGLPTHISTQYPGISYPNPNVGNNPNTPRGALSGGPAAATMGHINYQNMMTRQNSMNPNQRESFFPLNHNNANNIGNPSPSSSFQGGMSGNQPQSQGNPGLQQHQMMEQLLKGMSGNNNVWQQNPAPLNGQNTNLSNVPGGVGPTSASGVNGGVFNNSNNNSNNHNNGYNQKGPDMPQNFRLTDDMVPDLPHDFAESGFFSDDLDENMGYGWKA